MTTEEKWVTRNQVRAMGLDVSNTQFRRYEQKGWLTPQKVGNLRSAKVRYDIEEVLALFHGPNRPPKVAALRKAA